MLSDFNCDSEVLAVGTGYTSVLINPHTSALSRDYNNTVTEQPNCL